MDHGSLEGEINLVPPKLTPTSKAMREELRGVKREMISMNHQNSLT
jgi:hypothetical protein